MPKKINLSIPQPCHENWKDMIPSDKGRFCASCQKVVIDFSQSSDREIAKAIKNNKHLCGRFRESQLNRDLTIPRERNSLWLAAGAAIISFLGLGTQEAEAQTSIVKEQTHTTPSKPSKKQAKTTTTVLATGTVTDDSGAPIKGLELINTTTSAKGRTNDKGIFKIAVAPGDRIELKRLDLRTQIIIFDGENLKEIIMHPVKSESMINGGLG